MKKFLLMLVASIMILGQNIHAGDNIFRLNAEIPRITSFEYERKVSMWLPGLSGFINYGSGSFDIDGDETNISGLNYGARYKIPFLGYISIGFGNLDIDYSYVATTTSAGVSIGNTVNVTGSISGTLIEYGNELGIGPVLVGGKLFYLMGTPDVSGTVAGQAISDDEIDSGAATIDGLPGFSLYVGLTF